MGNRNVKISDEVVAQVWRRVYPRREYSPSLVDGAVEKVLRDWVNQEPEIYIGTTPSGLAFEIPDDKIEVFLKTLVNALDPVEIVVSFLKDSESKEFSCKKRAFLEFIKRNPPVLRDPSLMVEFDRHTLITGGEGCFSLSEGLSGKRKKQIALTILHSLGYSCNIRKGEFEIMIQKGEAEVTQ